MRQGIYPPKSQLYKLLRLCKATWHVRDLTVSIDGKGNWQYQTGDNSYMGPCYGHPIWAVVQLPVIEDEDGDIVGSENYNCRDYVEEIIEQLEEGYWQHVECRGVYE